MRHRDVVAPGADVEQPGAELAGLGIGIEGALVGEDRGPHRHDPAVGVDRQFAPHVVVAGEPGRDDVLRPGLNPLHRLPQQKRGGGGHHVPRVDGHLVPEPAADVRRDDPDVLLGQPRHQGEKRPVGVGCLAGQVDGGLPGCRVDVGDHPACLQRCGVRTRVEGVERHHLVRRGEGCICARLVAGLPRISDVVGLTLLLVPDERGVGLEAPLRVDDHRQLVIVHVDEREGIAGDVWVGGDHRRHFLPLVTDLVGGEHRLGVTGECRHPRQVVRRHQFAGDHRDHTVERLGLAGVDRDDPGVGQGRSEDGHVEHPG